jgi:phospholipid/cholesterol/gamma-HCH transport system substrate-binding protein
VFFPRPKRQPYALYGVAMLTVIGLLATLSIMAFKQEFTSTTPVSMKIQRAGLQLLKGSDVKMRGLIVGDVKSIDSTGDGATISLDLKPSMIKNIPSNVDAQLIPKTVFGEKYINLVVPTNPSPRHIAAGDVITQDHSTPALEIDQALNDLLPLLRTVRPQDLNSTLSAVASALSGRGEKLAETTVKLNNYLSNINPHLPQIQHDFQALAKVATTYDQAAPALLGLLRNFTVTSNTITDKSATFSALLKDLTGTALVTKDFVARNALNIVAVNVVNKNFLGLLAEYSPEYDCLFKGAANLLPRVKAAKSTTHTAAVRVEFHGPKPAYIYPLDAPEYNDYRGPACYGLPNPPLQLPTIQFKDGTEDDPRFADRNGHTDAQPLNFGYNDPDGGLTNPLAPLTGAVAPLTSTLLSPSSVATASPSMGDAGSASELASMDQILGPILGRDASKVPAIAGLLWGPMARGTEVDVS